jgi:hypothetical protein
MMLLRKRSDARSTLATGCFRRHRIDRGVRQPLRLDWTLEQTRGTP